MFWPPAFCTAAAVWAAASPAWCKNAGMSNTANAAVAIILKLDLIVVS